jgi:hypothetical protein
VVCFYSALTHTFRFEKVQMIESFSVLTNAVLRRGIPEIASNNIGLKKRAIHQTRDSLTILSFRNIYPSL